MRSSASKISASSEVGRCWVIRPHIASLVSSAGMDDPSLDAAVKTQGPLSNEIALRLIDRGRERLDAGDLAPAFADFQRVVGHEDPAITAAALLGSGDVLYRSDNETQATAQ